MFNSGCLELIVVAAAVVGATVFVIAGAIDLHAGMTLSFSAWKALSVAAVSFGSVALFLTLAAAATRFFGGNSDKRKP